MLVQERLRCYSTCAVQSEMRADERGAGKGSGGDAWEKWSDWEDTKAKNSE